MIRRSGRAIWLVAAVTTVLLGGAGSAYGALPAWTVQRAPQPIGADSEALPIFDSVSCPTVTFCMAVGYSQPIDEFDTSIVAERWNGSTWHVIHGIPDPGGSNLGGELSGVSCTSPKACIAVGSWGMAHALVERWGGHRWRLQTPATVPYRDPALAAVTCPSATSCLAVGSANNEKTGDGVTLVEHWNGTGWTELPTPSPAAAEDQLTAVTCTGARYCVAVGSIIRPRPATGTPKSEDLAEVWNGTTWSVQAVPTAPGGSSLAGVACASPSACVAVGETYGNAPRPVAASRNGRVWTLRPVAQAGAGDLAAVSCVGPTSCTAVGAVGDADATLAQHWNGRAWSIESTPGLKGSDEAELVGLDCRPGLDCVGVGDDQFNSAPRGNPGEVLIERN